MSWLDWCKLSNKQGETLSNSPDRLQKVKTIFDMASIHANYQSFWHCETRQKGVEKACHILLLTQHEILVKITTYQNNNSHKPYILSGNLSLPAHPIFTKQPSLSGLNFTIWWHFIRINFVSKNIFMAKFHCLLDIRLCWWEGSLCVGKFRCWLKLRWTIVNPLNGPGH